MGLDSLDDIEWAEWGAEQASEQSEKQREKSSKAMAWIRRTQKDEKKARIDNDYLFDLLVKILRDKNYDALLPQIINLIHEGVPSNFLIGILSLVYPKASDIIRENYSKTKKELISFEYTPSFEAVNFDENNLDPVIRKRINEWIDDIFSVISFDPSIILSRKFSLMLSSPLNKDITASIAEILIFFLSSLRISISSQKALLYSEFILGEVRKKISGVFPIDPEDVILLE